MFTSKQPETHDYTNFCIERMRRDPFAAIVLRRIPDQYRIDVEMLMAYAYQVSEKDGNETEREDQ